MSLAVISTSKFAIQTFTSLGTVLTNVTLANEDAIVERFRIGEIVEGRGEKEKSA